MELRREAFLRLAQGFDLLLERALPFLLPNAGPPAH